MEYNLKINNLSLIDQFLLKKRLEETKKIKKKDLYQTKINFIKKDIEIAKEKIYKKKKELPIVKYSKNLPILNKKKEIYETLKNNQVLIIAGETGSGKTTQIPKICLEMGRGIKGLIGHTQPRRLSACSIAKRISEELKTQLGMAVGYKIRFDSCISDKTFIKLMTDGILLSELQNDKLLLQYDTLIIDEAHERSLNIDFILGYLKKILPQRPDLKVIITSATIDLECFSRHFNFAPIIEVSGRNYPIEMKYRPIDDVTNQIDGIINSIKELNKENNKNNILVFLSSEKEIIDTYKAIKKLNLKKTKILPLFARLSNNVQHLIFKPYNGKKIVLSTNIAETSLTVPDINCVIDNGYARISRYNYKTKIQRLPIEQISQSSAEQRKGRCGRTAKGICIRLYSEEDFLLRPKYTDPEILRTNLSSVILQMIAIELGNINDFPFIQIPNKNNIQDGIKLLKELRAIKKISNNENYTLTEIGVQLAKLPIDPRLGKMLLEAKNRNCVHEIMVIISALSIKDPREQPIEKNQYKLIYKKHFQFNHENSDFIAFLNLWNFFKKQKLSSLNFYKKCKKNFINYNRLKEWQNIYYHLKKIIKKMGIVINNKKSDYENIHISLLSGLLTHIGNKKINNSTFIGVRNINFNIFPNSCLFKKKPKWIMVADLVETKKLWGRTAAIIDPSWIEPLANHLIKKHYSSPIWSKKKGLVIALLNVKLFGLNIVTNKKINYSKIDPELCRKFFIRHALVEGNWHTKHKFYQKNLKLISKIEQLENKSRKCNILVNNDILFDFYENKINKTVVSSKEFDIWWEITRKKSPDLLNFKKNMLINNTKNEIKLIDYPNYWNYNNFKFKLTYKFKPGSSSDGVTIYIPLFILNEIKNKHFDWQIQGLRKPLIIALIKSLPKKLRRNFVPLSNYAEAFLEKFIFPKGHLLNCLSKELHRMTGININLSDWQLNKVPEYLKIIFCVINENNEIISQSRDLSFLKITLKNKIKKIKPSAIFNDIEKNDLKTWDFNFIPKFYTKKYNNCFITAYPSLVDKINSVEIRVFFKKSQQYQEMKKGLSRLLFFDNKELIKKIYKIFPNKSKLESCYINFGNLSDLINDCIMSSLKELIIEFGNLVWTFEEYNKLNIYVKNNFINIVIKIAHQVEIILNSVFIINKILKKNFSINLIFSFSDIKSQIKSLIFKGFVLSHGYKKIPDIIRYLDGIKYRLEKLIINPNSDRKHMITITNIKNKYFKLLDHLICIKKQLSKIKKIYWMIEELRINLFSQHLSIDYSISEKKLLLEMEKISLFKKN